MTNSRFNVKWDATHVKINAVFGSPWNIQLTVNKLHFCRFRFKDLLPWQQHQMNFKPALKSHKNPD